MYSQLVLLVAAAASASASIAKPEVRAATPSASATGQLLPDISKKCQTEVLSVLGSVPTPPAQLLTASIEGPATDLCDFNTAGSLGQYYSSYSSELVSWVSENKEDVASVLSDCPELESFATSLGGSCNSLFASLLPVSGDSTMPASATASATGSGSGSMTTAAASDSGSAGTSTAPASATPTNAAPRETGMVMAVLAAAGLAAVAM